MLDLKPLRQNGQISKPIGKISLSIACFTCLASVFVACVPSSNQLSSEEIAQNLATHIQVQPHVELAQPSKLRSKSLTTEKVSGKLKQEVAQFDTSSVMTLEDLKTPFSPSDRMWGEMALPAQALSLIHI